MQKILFLTSLLALVVATSTSDAQLFERTLGGILDDQPQCIEHTNDGGYIIAGTESELILT